MIYEWNSCKYYDYIENISIYTYIYKKYKYNKMNKIFNNKIIDRP